MINFNWFLLLYLFIFVLQSFFDKVLTLVNIRHYKSTSDRVFQVFKGHIEKEDFFKSIEYNSAQSKLDIFEGSIKDLIFILVICTGFFPWLAFQFRSLSGGIAGFLFFGVLGILAFLLDIPFSYYSSFVIEERFGFNTKTLGIWLSDLIKALLISVVLGGVLLGAILAIVYCGGRFWWLIAWCIFFCFQILMTLIYPTLIAPIFNKFEPLDDQILKQEIEALMQSQGLKLKGIYQMDASRRTRHTNAYFSGLGKAKRLVLYDSLIKAHDQDEIVAIVAHELGHFKKGHINKQIIINGALFLGIFFVAGKIVSCPFCYDVFGFTGVREPYIGLLLIGLLWEPIGFFLAPLFMAISRKFEREADIFAVNAMGTGEPLATALKKIAKDNLSNLNPHPVYVLFHYSHPPLAERINRLQS